MRKIWARKNEREGFPLQRRFLLSPLKSKERNIRKTVWAQNGYTVYVARARNTNRIPVRSRASSRSRMKTMDDPPPLGISFSIATAAAAVLLLLSSPTARIDFLLLLLLPAGDRKRGGGERPVVGSEWVWMDG